MAKISIGIYIKHVCDLKVNLRFFIRMLLSYPLKCLHSMSPTHTEREEVTDTEERERDYKLNMHFGHWYANTM